ncbi:MAG: hypothetical protein AMXMBFR84_40440 [Candidatus Hydrogenedentota bacterium]
MQDALLRLSQAITVSHGLDESIQAEVYGHLEDKLAACLASQPTPSNEEELLNEVRRHFGDPAALSQLLRRVHAVDYSASLARRISAGIAAILVLNAVWCFVALAGSILFAIGTFRNFVFIKPLVLGCVLLGMSMGLVLLFRHWQEQLTTRKLPWFVRWNVFQIAALLVLLVIVVKLIPTRILGDWGIIEMTEITFWTRTIKPVNMVLVPCAFALQCAALIWWCDPKIQNVNHALIGIAAWIFLGLTLAMIPSAEYLITRDPEALASSQSLGVGHYLLVRGPSFPLYIGTSAHFHNPLYFLGLNLIYFLVPILPAFAVYALLSLFERRLFAHAG